MPRLHSPFMAAWLFAATLAQAGPSAPAAADPLDARAVVPPAAYESAFRHYRGHADIGLKPWKAANDEVGRIGGWRAYAREAARDSAAVEPNAQAPVPHQPGAHHGHRAKP